MLYSDIFDLMREEYSIVLDEGLDDNTNLFAKMASYALNDRIYKTVNECPTKGYIHITGRNKNVNEDLLMLLIKEQHSKEVSTIKTPCDSIVCYYKDYIV